MSRHFQKGGELMGFHRLLIRHALPVIIDGVRSLNVGVTAAHRIGRCQLKEVNIKSDYTAPIVTCAPALLETG